MKFHRTARTAARACAIVVLFIVFASACQRESTEPVAAPAPSTPMPGDVLITLERTACYGTCPSYVVTLDANGVVTWNGRDHVDVRGEQHARVSVDVVRDLWERFQRADFATLHDRYAAAVTDNPTTILGLRSGAIDKHVTVYAVDQLLHEDRGMLLVCDAGDAKATHVEWSDFSSKERAAYRRLFQALDELAAAIDTSTNTERWIHDASRPSDR